MTDRSVESLRRELLIYRVVVVVIALALPACGPSPTNTTSDDASTEKTLEYEGIQWRIVELVPLDITSNGSIHLDGDVYLCDDPNLALVDLYIPRLDDPVYKRIISIHRRQADGTWEQYGLRSHWIRDGSYGTQEYQNDQIHGPQLEYYADGQIKVRRGHANDQWHGDDEMWYENGQKMYEGENANGEEHGHWNLWNEDGTLSSESESMHGVQISERRLFYSDGRLVIEIIREGGIEVSRREWDVEGNEIE